MKPLSRVTFLSIVSAAIVITMIVVVWWLITMLHNFTALQTQSTNPLPLATIDTVGLRKITGDANGGH